MQWLIQRSFSVSKVCLVANYYMICVIARRVPRETNRNADSKISLGVGIFYILSGLISVDVY